MSELSTKPEDSICAAVDGSPASLAAVAWAANTATKRGIALRLAAAFTTPQFLYAEGMTPPQDIFDDLRQDTMDKVAEAKEYALSLFPDLTVVSTVVEGSPIDMLLELSRRVTMIVMGSRGLGGLSSMVMGSVSAALVSHAHCPVVVVREDSSVTTETKYGPVVVGVDGSPVSEMAVEYAFAEAAARGAVLRAVHTWMDAQTQASLGGLAVVESRWDEIEADHAQLVKQDLQPFVNRYPDVQVELVLTRERPVKALADAAKDSQLLVLGSHGRGGFKGMLLGSTSRALLQSAPCPMMVVRPDSR